MVAEDRETASQAVQVEAASAGSGRSRAPGESSSTRRARKRATRRAAAPRSAATSNLVDLSGEFNAEGLAVVSESQALIDLEIRRSMREARRARDQQLQAQQAQDANSGSDDAAAGVEAEHGGDSAEGAALQVVAESTDGPEIQVEPSSDDVSPVAHPRQHPGHGKREATAANPLNQHLSLMTQQLTAAHRVIGRVSAERDALRQQVADLQGIPVEEVIIASVTNLADSEKDRRTSTTAEPEATTPPSLMAKLNYFGGEDVAQMRRRRQTFVLTLLGVIVIGGIVARMIGWSMPEDISRDSLAALPVLGNFMYVFLAGWMLFRVVKVSSRGVRWIFPSEDRRRRRR